MTVSSSTNRVSYAGNGSTTVFPYTYKIFDEDDLTVILRAANGTETVQTITSDYTVSGVGNAGGGNVTMLTAPATGETLVVLREQDLVQELDIVPNDPFPADSLEAALDKLTFMVQQHKEELDRALKVSRTNTISTVEFTEAPATRANKFLGFDASGDLFVASTTGGGVIVSVFMQDFLLSSTGSAALTYLGVTSSANELNILDGVTATTSELNILDGVTASTAELNILDGVTASTAELNILDGVTASTAELNILDGVTASTAELNILDGVTATSSELNVLDGIAGIASQAEAQAGTATDKLMTPLRVKEAIDALAAVANGSITTAKLAYGTRSFGALLNASEAVFLSLDNFSFTPIVTGTSIIADLRSGGIRVLNSDPDNTNTYSATWRYFTS